jgi:hypothetical protein
VLRRPSGAVHSSTHGTVSASARQFGSASPTQHRGAAIKRHHHICHATDMAGGSIAVPKTDIGNGFGFSAHFIDTEGNKVGLHSMG